MRASLHLPPPRPVRSSRHARRHAIHEILRRPKSTATPTIQRVGMRPLAKELVQNWITAMRDDDEEPETYEGTHKWGTARGGQQILESDIRELNVSGQWAIGAVDTWCEWWRLHQAAIPSGTWLAPTGTVVRSLQHQREGTQVLKRRVRLHGPREHTRMVRYLWFPFREHTGQWSVVCAHLDRNQLQTYGEVPARWLNATKAWMDAWTSMHLPHRTAVPWAVREVNTGDIDWKDAAQVCLALANWMCDSPAPSFSAAR